MDAIIEKEFYKHLEKGLDFGADKELALFIWKMAWYTCQNWELTRHLEGEDEQDNLSDIEALVTGG